MSRKTHWCDSINKDVTIEDCVKCRLMCVYNPSAHTAMLYSSAMVVRWGNDEIKRFLESWRVVI